MTSSEASPVLFSGFGREAIDFLADLAANNDRAWFQPRKGEYERLLKRPLEALCVELAVRFAARGIPLASDPARSPFRIYRDVRFSRDKSPYKPYVSASFPWAGEGTASTSRPAVAASEAGDAGGGATAPGGRSGSGARRERHIGGGGYFHLGPGEVFVGGGVWHPDPHVLVAWRELVVRDPGTVHGAIEDPAFAREFVRLEGDRLGRVPRGFPPEHPDADLLRLKDLTFGRRLSDADAQSAGLPDLIADALAAAVPVLRLIAGLAPG